MKPNNLVLSLFTPGPRGPFSSAGAARTRSHGVCSHGVRTRSSALLSDHLFLQPGELSKIVTRQAVASHERREGAIVRGEPGAQLSADLCWLLLRREDVVPAVLVRGALARCAVSALSTAAQPNVASQAAHRRVAT